ncbi:MAG: phosphatidate cytidylyltransferase [Gammaproteobacteria bacterium]|nr:MAG: phosphatidate cytidylyltransferase [Gammaproteobacteria bacterium]
MLKQRLLTAIILIPLIVWVLLSLSSQTFAWFLSIFVILGAYEWAGICGWHSKMARSLYTITISLVLLMGILNWELGNFVPAKFIGNGFWLMTILIVACLWWLLALFWVLRYQQGHSFIPVSPFIKGLLGFLILLPPWVALLILHEHFGGPWVLFLLVLIWAADSGAYFIGKRWGKTKLAEKISPGKTYEGVAGALLTSFVVSLIYALFQSMSLMTLLFFMLLCLLTVMASILGDLLESLFKRQAGIKDSGKILPGHGGVLDRIDSLTSAAPIFVLCLLLLGNLF